MAHDIIFDQLIVIEAPTLRRAISSSNYYAKYYVGLTVRPRLTRADFRVG